MKRLLNLTIEIEDKNIPILEKAIEKYFIIKSLKILPDTQKMYDKSEHFRKLVKAEKDAKKIKAEFINEFNFAYNAKK